MKLNWNIFIAASLVALVAVVVSLVVLWPSTEETPPVTPGPTPTGIGYPTVTPTVSPTSTGIGYPTPTATPTASPTGIGYPTPTATPTASPTGIGYPTPTATPTISTTPTATPTGIPEATVWIGAPGEVPAGGSFIAYVNVSEVEKLGSADYDVVYNSSILEVTDVPYAGGVIGGSAFEVDMWAVVEPGRVRIIQSAPGLGSWVSGSGYLAEIHFDVIGSSCDASGIEPVPGPFDGGLFNSQTQRILVDWSAVHVAE